MRPDQLLRSTVAGAFSFTARLLTTAADITAEVARRTRPDGPATRERPFEGLEHAAETAGRAAETAGREAAATAERAAAGAGERAEEAGERAGEAAARAAGAGKRTAKKASAAARRARAAAESAVDQPAGGTGPQVAAAPPGEPGDAAGNAADAPVGAVPARARTYDTHAAEIADQPAAQVIAAVGDLSTDELRQLYEHEAGHKKRRTVLEAIEAGLAPGPS